MKLICGMQQFIVSARKYRPLTFEDVVGQKHVAETLLHEIENNRLAQAFLFTGPRGVGKTTCARILAKVLNASSTEETNLDFSFNIFELDAASNNSVEDIRNLIDQVRIPPQIGRYKIYIIDEVHMLSTSAFNAFLKTLEEPPSYAIFILATTEKHKILPTILSRCQVFNFNRIQTLDMVNHLKKIAKNENISVSDEALHLIARKADGGLRDALSLFDQLASFSNGEISYEKAIEMLSILDADTFFSFTDFIVNGETSKTLLLLDEILRNGFDGSLIIEGLTNHFRNLLVSKDPLTNSLLDVSDSYKEKYIKQSNTLELSFLINAINLSNEADEKFRLSRNPRLLIELTLLKLVNLRNFISNLPTLEDLKKKNHDTQQIGVSKTISDKIAPSIREDVEKKVASTRLGLLDRSSFKKSKQEISDSNSIEQEIKEKNSVVLEHHEMIERIISTKSPRLSNLLKSVNFDFTGSDLKLIVQSKMQFVAIEEIKTELTQEIISLSNNRYNSIIIELGEVTETTRKPYTDKEKLDFLVDKHPMLQNAIDKLQLRLP
jgi:DNA polymerase-3 subunit gamma/tau